MKKILLILLGLVLLMIIGLVTYVSMIDWNEHKSKIAASLSELTGKKVVFNGSFSVSLFPSPQLNASKVEIYNSSGAYSEKPLASIRSLSAKVPFSSLFGGEFDVSRVSLSEPEINFEISSDGGVNWASNGQKFQEENIRQMQISLDSVTLENATFHFLYPQLKIDTKLSNLNAEIIAESVFGPYRIEGSYTKGDNPEGFAISLGRLAENIATSVNLAVNFPTTKSFARFDGTVYFRDRKILGNIIAESETPVDFAQDMFALELDKTLNQKFALTAAVDSGLEKVLLNNVVIKYGKTSGAGNILIPLPSGKEEVYRPRVEMAFNMTDLDLDTPVALLRKRLPTPSSLVSNFPAFEWPFDLIGDVKSLKSFLNGKNLQDLSVSFDVDNGVLFLRNLNAKVDDTTTFQLNGQLSVLEGQPNFEFSTSFDTQNFLSILEWLGHKLSPVAPATFQKASGRASLKGEGEKIFVSPLSFALDNIVVSGEAGVFLSEIPEIMFDLEADTINFDNYISSLPETEKQKSFMQKVFLTLSDIGLDRWQNMTMIFNLQNGIFRDIPFEGLQMDILFNKGRMGVNRFEISRALDSSLILSGNAVKNDKDISFENMQYNFQTQNFKNLVQKTGVIGQDLSSVIKQISSKGVFSGNMQSIALKSESEIDKNNLSFSGVVDFSNPHPLFDGTLEVRSSDFVKMLNDFGIVYTPQAFSLGLFNAKTDFQGTIENFKAQNLDMNVGANTFRGKILFDVSSGRPKLNVQGKINRFETSRFLPETKNQDIASFQNSGGGVIFLQRPSWDKKAFDFSFLTKIDVFADLQFDEFLWRNFKFTESLLNFSLNSGKLVLDEFGGKYANGEVKLAGNLEVGAKPNVDFELTAKGLFMSVLDWGGKIWGIRNGYLSFVWDAKSILSSEQDFFDNLNGSIAFDIQNLEVRGWNLSAVENEIRKRTEANGLSDFVLANLQSGATPFKSIIGTLKLSKGDFSFEDLSFDGEKASLQSSIQGSLKNWEFSSDFDVSWAEKISPIKFQLTGSLENPLVSVDVSQVEEVYNQRKAKIEADKKAKELADKEALKNAFEKQVAQTKVLKNEFEEKLLPQAETVLEKMEDKQARQNLEKLRDKINQSVGALNEVSTLALSPQITQEIIDTAQKKNEDVAKVMPSYYAQLESLFLEETKKRLEKYREAYNLSYEKLVKDVDDFKSDFQNFPPRLKQADSLLNLDEVDDIKNMKAKLDAIMQKLSDTQSKSDEAYRLVAGQDNPLVLERVIDIFKENQTSLDSEYQKIKDDISQTLLLCEKLVSEEEEINRQRHKELERQQKIKQATGKISDASGNVKTIVPDINRLEKTEEKIEKDEIKVLDFSEKNKVRRDDEPVRKTKSFSPSSGLVSQSTGKDLPLRGTVVKD